MEHTSSVNVIKGTQPVAFTQMGSEHCHHPGASPGLQGNMGAVLSAVSKHLVVLPFTFGATIHLKLICCMV
jgi:hypothetical protein